MFKIYLCKNNVPLYPTYENVLNLDHTGLLDYIAKIDGVESLNGLFEDYNQFSFGDGVITNNFVFSNLNKKYSLEEMINSNYLILQFNNEYYFYFITNCIHEGTTNKMTYNLELDVFHTYHSKITYNDKIIVKRGHLNRFKRQNNKYIYNIDYDSELQTSEEMGNKYQKLQLLNSIIKIPDIYNGFDTINSDIHGKGWIWVVSTNASIFRNVISGYVPQKYKINGLETPYWLFAFPVNQMNVRNYGSTTSIAMGINYNLFQFDYNVIVTMFYTPFAPFSANDFNIDTRDNYRIGFDSGVMRIVAYQPNSFDKATNVYTKNCTIVGTSSDTREFGGIVVQNDKDLVDNKNIKVFIDELIKSDYIEYDKAQITNNLEPKLALSPFYKIAIGHGISEPKEYNPLLINGNIARIRENTIISAESYNRNAYIDINESFINANIGTNTITINSLPYAIAQLQTYLANNKNALLTGLVVPAGIGIATGGMSLAASGVSSAIIGQTAIRSGSSAIGYFSNMDNLANAPDQYKGANANAFATLYNNNSNLIFSRYELIPHEKEIVKDYFFKYGYAINKFYDIKKIMNCRVGFNYIETSDLRGNFKSSRKMTNIINDKMVEIYNNGVRVWNTKDDFMNFNINNIEIDVVQDNMINEINNVKLNLAKEVFIDKNIDRDYTTKDFEVKENG